MWQANPFPQANHTCDNIYTTNPPTVSSFPPLNHMPGDLSAKVSMPKRGEPPTSHASHANEGPPPTPLLKKKKQGAFTYESIIESPPKSLLPPSPQRVVRQGSGFAKGDGEDREEEEVEGSKPSMQVPPLGYKLGRAPPFLAYFKRQGAGEYKVETEEELPQLAAARAAGGKLQGGAWDPTHSFHDNAGRLLDHIANSLLEEEAAELSYLDEDLASVPSGMRGGGGRRATAPVQRGTPTRQAREAFERPLVWVPTSASTSTSTCASSSTSPSCIPGPCMLISKAKVASLAGGGTGLWDGQLGYANLLLGSFPTGHGISEGVHRLVKEFIMGPSPAIKRKRGGRQPVYPKGGYWVCCHICGNKSCLNPFHLVWGSEADNKKDEMATYQRLAKEQGHPEWSIPRERPRRM